MTGQDTGAHLAVVGLACRFPGSDGPDEFWRDLLDGRDRVTRAPGHPAYGELAGGNDFEAALFGFSPLEALMIDPQHRVFLECAREALEHAGCDPRRPGGVIGVFGGSGDTGHFTDLLAHRDRFPGVTRWQLRLAAGADFLTSRVAYKLGLTGPAVTVQTACSTSLVAVHLACQALLAGDCDVALAGGVTVRASVPLDEGDDDVLAGDGHCRPFDVASDGTVAGDGVGVVVLKRLDDAIADGDAVHAVVLGSAVTNDGAAKVGFTAPGVAGQSSAVRAAHAVADVDPATIGFVEAHGTATPAGDPIEVRALANAFGDGAADCVLGSVKGSIGHTDAAAGVAGLIKAVLAVREGVIPGTAHFREPNPLLELGSTPFRVTSEAEVWGGSVRRAGVNSLGLGGTNAHVVLQQPPVLPVSEPSGRAQVLPLSGRTLEAVLAAAGRLARRLDAGSGVVLDDVAWTLQTGRTSLAHRTFVVAGDPGSAVRSLAAVDVVRAPAAAPGVAFLYPGQGGQHPGMAVDLHESEPVFRAAFDRCAELAAPELGVDLREVVYGDRGELLGTMTGCQPALFAVQHALTELWRDRGVRPTTVLGHSLGAYAAATAAGVLAVEDALDLVMTRGRLLDSIPAGAMLAVPLPEAELTGLLDGRLSLAAVNGVDQCAVAGPADEIEGLRERLDGLGVDARVLRISAAAHSSLVEPVVDEYTARVRRVRLSAPEITWISDRTGRPVSVSEATDPVLWGRHLRDAVRFADALGTLLTGGDALLEIGPGQTLGGLARRHPAFVPHRSVVRSLPHAADGSGGEVEFLRATGALWAAGVEVDWGAVHHGRARRKVPLPGYPYQRARYRLDEPLPGERSVAGERLVPGERSVAGERLVPGERSVAGERWVSGERSVTGEGSVTGKGSVTGERSVAGERRVAGEGEAGGGRGGASGGPGEPGAGWRAVAEPGAGGARGFVAERGVTGGRGAAFESGTDGAQRAAAEPGDGRAQETAAESGPAAGPGIGAAEPGIGAARVPSVEPGGGRAQEPAVERGAGGARGLGGVEQESVGAGSGLAGAGLAESGLAEGGVGLGGARAGSGCGAGVGERAGAGGRAGAGARAEGGDQVGVGALDGLGGGAGWSAPGSDTEKLVAEVFGEVLGVSGLGGGDDFFALGGDSLIALRVVRRLRPVFGDDLSARVVFRASTVAGLAALLDERGRR